MTWNISGRRTSGDPVKIKLDLSRHCVKTAARKAHETRIRAFFRASDEKRPEILSELAALRGFLESTDFPEARFRYPVLAGGTDKEIILEGNGEDTLVLAFDESKIPPPKKLKEPHGRAG